MLSTVLSTYDIAAAAGSWVVAMRLRWGSSKTFFANMECFHRRRPFRAASRLPTFARKSSNGIFAKSGCSHRPRSLTTYRTSASFSRTVSAPGRLICHSCVPGMLSDSSDDRHRVFM